MAMVAERKWAPGRASRRIDKGYSIVLMEKLPAGAIVRVADCDGNGVVLDIERRDGRQPWWELNAAKKLAMLTSRAIES